MAGFYQVIFERWVPEDAKWFGQTGLDAATERELPKYLRREFGENWLSSKYLKASDLEHVGAFSESDTKVHYWQVPWGKEEVCARVTVTPTKTSISWGGHKKPPTTRSST